MRQMCIRDSELSVQMSSVVAKQPVFEAIMSLQDLSLKRTLLEHCLDEDHNLGKIMYYKRMLTSPSVSKGTLRMVDEALKETRTNLARSSSENVHALFTSSAAASNERGGSIVSTSGGGYSVGSSIGSKSHECTRGDNGQCQLSAHTFTYEGGGSSKVADISNSSFK